jgi:mannose-6-phosphate isomerase-like protein (cupin superfamily)
MIDEQKTEAFGTGAMHHRTFWSLGGLFDIKAAGTDTRNRYSVFEAVMTKLAEPPLHIHHREDEAWYVLDGKLTIHVGDLVIEAVPGTFAFAPMDIPHRFTVDVEPTRVMVTTSPGGNFEKFVEAAGVPVESSRGPLPIDPPKLMELSVKYGIELLGPPPG